MRKGTLLVAVGAVGLLGFGVWLGRSSTSTSEAAPAAQVAVAPRTATLPRAANPPAPSLAARHVEQPSRALAADLSDGDPKVRRAAIREVAHDRDADPAVLLAASRDADLEVGVIATEGLGRLHAAGSIPASELITRASDHGLPEKVRVAALNGLATVPTPESAAYLADLLARGDTFERINAAILVGHQDLEIAMPALIRALADADQHVRDNALETLRSRSRGHDFGTDVAAWQAWWQSRPR